MQTERNKSEKPSGAARPRAFTLIELPVVIDIANFSGGKTMENPQP
jgi:hypothetical protein